MSKHTPGPWEVSDYLYPSFKIVVGPSFDVTAVMRATHLTEDDFQRRSADLALIAAAPELLEALILCRTMVGHPDNIAIIDAAIAKATGAE